MNKGFYVYLVWSDLTKTMVYVCNTKELATKCCEDHNAVAQIGSWYYTEDFVLGSDR